MADLAYAMKDDRALEISFSKNANLGVMSRSNSSQASVLKSIRFRVQGFAGMGGMEFCLLWNQEGIWKRYPYLLRYLTYGFESAS